MITVSDMFDIASSMNHVHRWNGRHIINHRRSLSEHSYEVSMVALQLYQELTDIVKSSNLMSEVLHYALIHDVTERITGDVPYIAKVKYPQLKSALDEIEKEDITSQFSSEAKFIVKLADIYVVFKEIGYEISVKGESEQFNYDNVLDILEATRLKYIKLSDSFIELFDKLYNEIESTIEAERHYANTN